jgi:LmbE family N-acetylglucosaminyl deacetylase
MRTSAPGRILNGHRTAIVAAHPDDETLGAGHCLRWLREPVIIHITDGAPRDLRDAAANGFSSRQEYAEERRREFLECLRAGDVHPAQMIELGYVDQEASLRMPELAREIQRLLQRCRIEVVLTHPYEGGHPDHDATALAVRAACLRLPPAARPVVMEFTSYHNRDGRMETGTFLPDPNAREIVFKLGADARARKERMLACFQTQKKVLEQFGTAEEHFRPAPVYDFTAPPHAGPLFYEAFQLGMTAERWRSLAREAMDALAVEESILE